MVATLHGSNRDMDSVETVMTDFQCPACGWPQGPVSQIRETIAKEIDDLANVAARDGNDEAWLEGVRASAAQTRRLGSQVSHKTEGGHRLTAPTPTSTDAKEGEEVMPDGGLSEEQADPKHVAQPPEDSAKPLAAPAKEGEEDGAKFDSSDRGIYSDPSGDGVLVVNPKDMAPGLTPDTAESSRQGMEELYDKEKDEVSRLEDLLLQANREELNYLDSIDTLKAENARLREALEKIATDDYNHGDPVSIARAALTGRGE